MHLGRTIPGIPLHIDPDARARHVYLVGATGSGKTTLIENMIAQDLAAGQGVAFIDPHGDSTRKVLSLIPTARADHLVYIDLASDFPVGLNFMTGLPLQARPAATANIVASFLHIWGHQAIGDRSQQVLRNSVRALMDCGGTLFSILRLLRDETYRQRVIATTTDPVNRAYWTQQYPSYDKPDDVTAPILNKLDAFMAYPSLRCILGNPQNTIDLRRIMDERRILIVNLNKGAIGGPALIFGALLVSALAQHALARADISETDRVPFFLYADEFQNYSTGAISEILSELRKYRLHLTFTHQYLNQVDEPIQQAILANAATLIAFRVGADDSPLLARHFDMPNPKALQNLKNYQAYIRPLDNGQPIDATLFDTLPPAQALHARVDALLKQSRQFTADRAQIEARLSLFLSKIAPAPRRQARRNKKSTRHRKAA